MERENTHAAIQEEGPFPIVGVGASAGGIEALEGFLGAMEPSVGAAIVLVLHLDPSRPSMIPEILGRAAQVPVREAVDGVVVEPGHVYVIPPNATLTMNGRRLCVSGPPSLRHTSIDRFLGSLAEEHGEAAIGIILSGAGSDGASGLRAVKEHGGVTMAQEPEEARSDSMPRSAIALSAVDWILPVAEMPAKIAAYGRTLGAAPPAAAPAAAEDAATGLRAVLAQVLRKTGHDFVHYKQATMLRRVQRRMRITGAGSLAAYAELLRKTPAEIDRLFGDLLIGVTHFFRDPEVFAALAGEVIPALLHGRGADAELRLWVPGCATGEEAYSLAILIHEAVGALEVVPPVKMFATDIDEPALDFARQGRYPPSIAEEVSAERLDRFFRKLPGGYQVNKEIRDMCVFSTHNIVSDPPFSKLDLISCRNLLIYLEAEIQKKLVPLFHYALAPGGYLVLGPSENLAAYPELFRVVDKDHRVFQRLDAPVAPAAVFPLSGPRRLGRLERAEQLSAPPRAVGGELGVTRAFEHLLLQEFAPPAVMVNGEGKILYVSGPTGRFLQLPPGMTRTDLVDMAIPALRPNLYTALQRAIKSGKPAAQEGLMLELEGAVRRVDVIVRPMNGAGTEPGLFMVVFRELGPVTAGAPAAEGSGGPSAEVELVADLERELLHTREHLQSTIEELETGSEELQSANEELLSTNEELQSANEELQTSREEQQSINEELTTVNLELVRKVEELDRVNSDLRNLFASMQIATLFLDGELRIKRFSPTATELLRVIESDVGRPVTDIAATFSDGDLVGEVREVLASLSPREREVYRAEGDRWYSRRIRPYRSLENVIDGVVITLVDVTDLKRAQDRLAGLAAIVESSQDAIVGVGKDGAITTWNAGAERIFGYAAREAIGLLFASLYPPEGRAVAETSIPRAARGEHVEVADVACVRKDGRVVDVFMTLSPVRDAAGEVVALSAIAHDVTERRRAERLLRRSEDRFRRLSESGVISIAFLDQQGRISDANDALLAMVGYGREDLTRGALQLERLVSPESSERIRALVREMWAEGKCTAQEVDCVRRDGSRFVCLLGGARLEGGDESVVFVLDVTERRRVVDELRRSEERLRLAMEATMLGTWEFDAVSGATRASPRAREMWGVAPDAEVTYDVRLACVHPDDRRLVDEATRRAIDPTGAGEYRMAYRVVRPNGETRWTESWGRAFFTDEGGFRRPVRLIGALLDVTDRKRTEEALKEADRRKDLFLAVLGHELRNPLAPIRNAVRVMGKAGVGDASLARAREIIERQVRHMTHLLDDLLDVGRLASGKISLRKERMDLVELARATVEEQRPDAEVAGLTLTASLPERPLWILADPTRIAQSVANLLVNAVKFTPGGGHVVVTVAPEPGGAADHLGSAPAGAAVVTVSDDGMGLEPEMLERLFEPFSQADRSLDRSRGGLGLGLSLVKSFMEMHGGSVGVRSEGPGKGSAFTLRLPLADEAPAPAPAPAAPARPRRVLLVEDNVDAAESMMMLLELAGHQVALAYNGAEGVEQARAFRPEVVLCDIGLPGDLDGYGVARALRADPSMGSAHLIALTGYGQEEDKLRAREAGFEAHLTKPIDPDTLERIIAEGPAPPESG
jgi:two-component system CheB/CheR fusion protein